MKEEAVGDNFSKLTDEEKKLYKTFRSIRNHICHTMVKSTDFTNQKLKLQVDTLVRALPSLEKITTGACCVFIGRGCGTSWHSVQIRRAILYFVQMHCKLHTFRWQIEFHALTNAFAFLDCSCPCRTLSTFYEYDIIFYTFPHLSRSTSFINEITSKNYKTARKMNGFRLRFITNDTFFFFRKK